MRRPLIAGNWKMNLNLPAGRELVATIRAGMASLGWEQQIDLAVCPPFVYLFPMAKALAGSQIALGAQDVFYEPNGAFTGEISGEMLVETGVKMVIIGHSERRHTIANPENDAIVNRKVKAALAAGLTPILCVGETLAERQAARTLEVLTRQVMAGLADIDAEPRGRMVIAYEPVWAIGTGQNATPEQAQAAHAHIRGLLGVAVGQKVRILYGGSVKPENAAAIMSQTDVDGGLIGGASLNAGSFIGIVRATLAAKG